MTSKGCRDINQKVKFVKDNTDVWACVEYQGDSIFTQLCTSHKGTRYACTNPNVQEKLLFFPVENGHVSPEVIMST